MKSLDDAQFRANLAQGYLKEAEEDLDGRHWWTCVSNAQMAIENAGRAVIACFEPVEKVHDVSPQLERLLKRDQVPGEIKKELQPLVSVFKAHGIIEHIRSTYGDDQTRTPPWEIFTEDYAQRALEDARTVIRFAEQLIARYLNL